MSKAMKHIDEQLLFAAELDYFEREARRGFEDALRKNFWHGVASIIFSQRNQLLSLEEMLARVPFEGMHNKGTHEIEVAKIIGSEGRAQDFNADFQPTSAKSRVRWLKIARANLAGEYLPPIDVYQIGSVYFVRDGNHRVSVARALNQPTIEANITEIKIPAELAEQTNLEKAAEAYEREQFFARTRLNDVRPDAQVQPTMPGFYLRMLEHISTHRWIMGMKRNRPVTWDEAVVDWYDKVYLRVVEVVREHHLLAAFPGRSEADLYFWISEYIWFQHKKTGSRLNYEDAALEFASRSAGALQRLWWKMVKLT